MMVESYKSEEPDGADETRDRDGREQRQRQECGDGKMLSPMRCRNGKDDESEICTNELMIEQRNM